MWCVYILYILYIYYIYIYIIYIYIIINILSGKGESKPVLEYLPELFEPYGNQTVFTSGKDGIFLPGIPVGKTEMDELNVKVRLFSDPNQLSFVTVQLIKMNEDNF